MGSLVEAQTGHAQACDHAVEHGNKHPKLGRTSHAPQQLKQPITYVYTQAQTLFTSLAAAAEEATALTGCVRNKLGFPAHRLHCYERPNYYRQKNLKNRTLTFPPPPYTLCLALARMKVFDICPAAYN